MKTIYILVLSLFLAGTVQAQMGGGGGQQAFEPVVIPDVEEETLILAIPDKWYPFFRESEAKTDTYYFPTGQGASGWREAIHAQRFVSTLNLTEATEYYEVKSGANAKACAEHEVSFMRGGSENGYSRAEWYEHCTLANEDELHTLNKAILGNEKLYVVSKVWKSDPDQEERFEWERYLGTAFVCDPTTLENPCIPPSNGRGMGGAGMGGGGMGG